MANLRYVQTPSIQTLPAEPAGDVMVHRVFLHRPLALVCAEQPLLGWAPWCQSSCYQFRLVPRVVETRPVSKSIPSLKESAAVQVSHLHTPVLSWKEKDWEEGKSVSLHPSLSLC